MNRFTKFLIWVVGLIGIVQSAWLVGLVVPIDHVSSTIGKTAQTGTPSILVTAIAISVIVALVSLIMIITAICTPRKADQLRFKSSNGRLTISKSAIEKILQNRIMEQGNVNDVKVKLRLRTKNRVARVTVTAVDKLNQDLVQLGEEIQTIVTKQVQQLMDVEVKKVRVKVTPFETSNRRQKASRPRVV
ncbi:alkaline shock response membrane anchor protein AmaP [Lentilactobacillus otakiensis]|uniref:alkaline shock response membrane anchor protein AmaP n=1 Tax=Lentilactobacillus otakiensis TaxID=481720 RepID=UPI003D16E3BC